jgi:hypothetical protein
VHRAYFQTSAAPRPENSDSDEKVALFGLDTQMIYKYKYFITGPLSLSAISQLSTNFKRNRYFKFIACMNTGEKLLYKMLYICQHNQSQRCCKHPLYRLNISEQDICFICSPNTKELVVLKKKIPLSATKFINFLRVFL